jgi:hypothetical protein
MKEDQDFLLSLEFSPLPIPLSANIVTTATSLFSFPVLLSVWQAETLPVLTSRGGGVDSLPSMA